MADFTPVDLSIHYNTGGENGSSEEREWLWPAPADSRDSTPLKAMLKGPRAFGVFLLHLLQKRAGT